MRRADVLDEMLGTDQPAHAPARAVEVLPCRADRQSQVRNLWTQRGDAGEGNVEEAVVDLVGEDQNVVLHTNGADGFKLRF